MAERQEGTRPRYDDLWAEIDELRRQLGDQIKPFPGAGIDGFLSHFVMSIEFLAGDVAGRIVSFTMPPSTQTVGRSAPFVYKGTSENHTVSIPLPEGCTLPDTISEGDFLERPDGYFEEGKQSVWMQILNLDAKMRHDELGDIRIILGETLKREYPDIFQPSHGVAQSIGRRGFPAQLFFNPIAVIETPFGAFRAVHGTLAYGRITEFPPVGTPVTILESNPLEAVDDVLRAREDLRASVEPSGTLLALSHPIDAALRTSGAEAFRIVERGVEGAVG